MNRRMTLLGLLAAPFACITQSAKGDERTLTLRTDEQLRQALRSPQRFMFSDHAIDKVNAGTFIKVRSVAPAANGDAAVVTVRPGTMRIFRADSTKASDGKHGELHWTIGAEERTTVIKEPGVVIMVVRSLDGVVNWYSLQYDFRC